jgi:hypothetical protein
MVVSAIYQRPHFYFFIYCFGSFYLLYKTFYPMPLFRQIDILLCDFFGPDRVRKAGAVWIVSRQHKADMALAPVERIQLT